MPDVCSFCQEPPRLVVKQLASGGWRGLSRHMSFESRKIMSHKRIEFAPGSGGSWLNNNCHLLCVVLSEKFWGQEKPLSGTAETISAWRVEIEERAEALGNFAADCCLAAMRSAWSCQISLRSNRLTLRRGRSEDIWGSDLAPNLAIGSGWSIHVFYFLVYWSWRDVFTISSGTSVGI